MGGQKKNNIVGWQECFAITRWIVLACVLLGLLVSVPLSIRNAKAPLEGDERWYRDLSASVLNGQGYYASGEPVAEKSPGYPYYLAGVYKVFGVSPLPPRLIQAFIFSLVAGLTVLLGYRFTGSKAVALIAGIMTACNPIVAKQSTSLLGDGLFGFFAILVVIALDIAIRQDKLLPYLCAGVLWGISIYVRPTLFFFCPLVLLLFIVHKRFGRGVIFGSVVCCLAAFLVLLPWSIRNYQAFRVFTPLPAEGGYVLYWNWANWDFSPKNVPIVDFEYLDKHIPGMSGKIGYERDNILKLYTLVLIKKDPGRYVKSCIMKVVGLWTTVHWLTPGHKASKLLGAFRLIFLLICLWGIIRLNIDSVYKKYTIAAMAYVSAVVGLMSSPEYRFTFWLLPMMNICFAMVVSEAAKWAIAGDKIRRRGHVH